MQERYRIYQRGGKNFYAKDTKTGRAFSLNTSDEREAARLLVAKNQATEQPCLNVAMARVYLSAQSPEFVSRTWGQLIELVAKGYEGATAVRWRKLATPVAEPTTGTRWLEAVVDGSPPKQPAKVKPATLIVHGPGGVRLELSDEKQVRWAARLLRELTEKPGC